MKEQYFLSPTKYKPAISLESKVDVKSKVSAGRSKQPDFVIVCTRRLKSGGLTCPTCSHLRHHEDPARRDRKRRVGQRGRRPDQVNFESTGIENSRVRESKIQSGNSRGAVRPRGQHLMIQHWFRNVRSVVRTFRAPQGGRGVHLLSPSSIDAGQFEKVP